MDCDATTTPEQGFAALYSFYYREEQAKQSDLIGGPDPLPLPIAAEFLRCDPDIAVRGARIRRAAISAASTLILLRCHSTPTALRNEVWRALAVLRVPRVLVKKLEKKFEHACGTFLPPDVENQAGAIIDTTKELQSLQRQCCPCLVDCEIGPWNGLAIAEFRVEVNRKSDCIFQTIDPRCWHGVCPKNFADSFAMDVQTSDPPECRSSSICDPTLPMPIQTVMPPMPTQPWLGLLSEAVITAAFDIRTHLENVLKVKTTRGSAPHSFDLNYGLCESREWTICNPACLLRDSRCTEVCNSGKCAVEHDCGFASVQEAQPGRSSVLVVQKQIRFSAGLKPDMNAWAPLALKVMATEVADATCQPASACTGEPEECLQNNREPAQDEENCDCKQPQDSCTLVSANPPNQPAPFCPPLPGGG